MNSIITVEDHFIAESQKVLGQRIRIDTLPSALNLGLLKKLIPAGNAVYFAFLGGPVSDQGEAYVDGRFDAYIIVRHVGDSDARRRGDVTTVGAYEVARRLVTQLHGSIVPDIGRIKAKRINNLFSIQLEESFKAALYAITFEVPNMPFVFEADLASLDDFISFDAQYDIPDFETAAEHQKWLAEPPDYTTSQPDLADEVTNLNQ